METLRRDLKHALRTLARNPGFTAIAVLSLALGIGANTAIFTLTNAVFLNPIPIQDAAKVMEVYTIDHGTTTTTANLLRTAISFLNYKDYRDQNNVFTGLAAFIPTGFVLTGRGDPKPSNAMLVSANYFDLLGVRAALGRTFSPDEDRQEGGNNITVLSYGLWVRLFGGDAAALGKTLVFDSVPYTVIGVMPPNFKGTRTLANPELAWVPVSMHADALPGQLEAVFNERRMRLINVFGRLKPGVTMMQAEAEMKALAAGLEREYPRANRGRTVEIAPIAEDALGFLPRNQTVTAGIALSGVVGLVLLIACVNLANLLLARSAQRAREMGIRRALGAGRGRLIRQLLTESLVISIAGGAAGLLIGMAGSRLLWSFRPSFLAQNTLKMNLDWRVFAFTAAVTLLTGLVFGLLPAARISATNLAETLKTAGRGGSEGYAGNKLRGALVVGEVALALVALSGAGLLIRSMDRVQKINPGIETKNLAVFDIDIGPQHYSDERGKQFFRTVLDKAGAVPGVRSAALASNRPLGGGLLATLIAQGQDSDPNQRGTLILINTVTPSYFETVRIPLIEGRHFTDFDRQETRRVAVVSNAMARQLWPGQDAIGKRFRYVVGTDYFEVVGICGNSVTQQIGEQPQPIAYLAFDQNYQSAMSIQVLTNANPAAVLPAVMRQVRSLNTNMALIAPANIQDILAAGLWAPRVAAALFGIFGLLGMALASVGIYGVMAYMVAQRTNEIGLRMALGASPLDVLRLVVGQGMRMTGIGIAAGIGCGLLVTRMIGSLLFNVPAYDPLTFGSVSLVVAAVAFLAGWVPARRAARIDPVRALRQD